MSRVEERRESEQRIEQARQQRTKLEAERNAAHFQSKLSSQQAVAQQVQSKADAKFRSKEEVPKEPPRQAAKSSVGQPTIKQQAKEQTQKKDVKQKNEKNAKEDRVHEHAVMQQAITRRQDKQEQDNLDQNSSDEFFEWNANLAATGPAPTTEAQATSAPAKIPDEVYAAIVQHAYVHNAANGTGPSVELELNESVFGQGANVSINTDGKGGVTVHFSGLQGSSSKQMVNGSKEELQKRLASRGMSLKNLLID